MANAVNEEELLLKKRARRRLVGAVVLVLLAFLLLPRVLEHQPKPVQKDVAIQMPPSSEPAISNPARVLIATQLMRSTLPVRRSPGPPPP